MRLSRSPVILTGQRTILFPLQLVAALSGPKRGWVPRRIVCRGRTDFIHRIGCSFTEQTSQTIVPGERRGANDRSTGVSFPIGTARMMNFFRAAPEKETLFTPRSDRPDERLS